MSESPGHAWEPPEESADTDGFEFDPDAALDLDKDSDDGEESPETEGSGSEQYTPGCLGDVKVSATTKDKFLTAKLGSIALRKLYVQPGDRLQVYEHPRGLLVVPSYKTHEEKPTTDIQGNEHDHDPDGFDLDWAWDADEDDRAPEPEQWTASESGAIPPEVPWEEMVSYTCRNYSCQQQCLNHIEESCTQARECRSCHWVPVLDDSDGITHHLPDDDDPESHPESEAAEE